MAPSSDTRIGTGRRAEDHERTRYIEDMEKLEVQMGNMAEQITSLRIEVGKLGVKAGIWGALAGAATATIPLLGLLLAVWKIFK